jgi:hypothetical protein
MPHKPQRALMLWFVFVLQTMTPFIHAHAGAMQLNHGGFLHLHQGVHDDAIYPTASSDEPREEVDVAQGMPLRHVTLDVADTAAPPRVPAILPAAANESRPGAGLPAPPSQYLTLPDHTLPHALAPPVR